jgi:hypothetical protein
MLFFVMAGSSQNLCAASSIVAGQILVIEVLLIATRCGPPT